VRVKKGVEFAVSRRNRPLAELLEKLAAIQVNIKAFMLYTSFISNIPNVPQVAGVCKMLVDNDEEARKGFRDLNVEFWEEEVLLLRAPDPARAIRDCPGKAGRSRTQRERWLRKRSLWPRRRAYGFLRLRH